MNKKYELTNEKMEYFSRTVYRIKALKDFGSIKKGDLGGFIQSEINLSHCGDCWVYDNAEVYGNARVYNNAKVSGNAKIFDNARVFDNAIVYGNARVFGNAEVFHDARVYDDAFVRGDALLKDNVELTKHCLNIIQPKLYQYPITFTDRHITIGCKTMPFPEWLEVSKKDAIKIGLKEEYYDNVKNLLKLLIPQYYRGEL